MSRPACKGLYSGLAVGKDIGMIPIHIENQRTICTVGIKVATVLISLNDKACICANPDR